MNAAAADRQLSPYTQAALEHLRRLKPLDGYAAERYLASNGKYQVRLKRRNVPVCDEGFEDIVIDRSTGHVLGIRVITSRGVAGRGIVLVDKAGRPRCGEECSAVTVQMERASSTFASPPRRANSGGAPASSTRAASATPPADVGNEILLQYALMALGAIVVIKIIFATLTACIVLALPVLFLYASTNCPSNDSFDAKRELKRVMRGAHLPEENQPKGFFEQGLNRLAASVTTELATSLGYEIAITGYAGAARLACAKVPVAGAEYFWVGIFGKWRYVGQREIPGNGKKND